MIGVLETPDIRQGQNPGLGANRTQSGTNGRWRRGRPPRWTLLVITVLKSGRFNEC